MPTVAQVLSTINPGAPTRWLAATATSVASGYTWATLDNSDAEVQAANVGAAPAAGNRVLLVVTPTGVFCLGKIGA